MISSKKFDLIAILLTALVLVGVVCAMFLPKATVAGHFTGEFVYSVLHTVNITDDDYYTTYTDTSVSKITLKGTSAETNSHNVEIDESNITILGGGVYVIAGTLDDGSIVVDSADGAEVRLVLNGANITSSDFSAMYIKQSAKTVISLVPGTESSLTDGNSYNETKLEDGKPTATLYSKDDLVINGNGSLVVNGNYQDGIKANDVLKITEGTILVNAADEGINANDYIVALEAELNVTSGGDAVRCEHESEEKGFVAFEGTILSLISEGDGISASSALYMNNTITNITSGGGSQNGSTHGGMGGGFGGRGGMGGVQTAATDTVSTKAIKAGTNIVINGGSFTLDSKDDSLHSDCDLTIENGTFVISAGDDAVHAELNLILNPESMDITKCYEGLEGAYITINGGEISIISSDDGINATGENSANGMGGGMMNMYSSEEKNADEDIWLIVNGGHIYIETSGDGLDSNGSAVINGGFLEIYGPENNGNGSIDVGDGGYVLIMNGGSMLAVGSSGMAEHPTENSPQQSFTFYLEETYSAGSSISIIDSSGNEIMSGTSNKKFNWICMSTETIVESETYTLIIDGNEIMEITANGSFASSGSKSSSQKGMGGTGVTRGGMGGQGNSGRRK